MLTIADVANIIDQNAPLDHAHYMMLIWEKNYIYTQRKISNNY